MGEGGPGTVFWRGRRRKVLAIYWGGGGSEINNSSSRGGGESYIFRDFVMGWGGGQSSFSIRKMSHLLRGFQDPTITHTYIFSFYFFGLRQSLIFVSLPRTGVHGCLNLSANLFIGIMVFVQNAQ